MTNIENNRTPYLEADLQFTAYSVTTTTLVAGNCITHTGLPTPLLGGYIVPIPVVRAFPGDFPASLQTVTGSLSRIQFSSYTDEKYSGFLDDAYSSFYEEIGYKGCVATLPPSQIYPMYIGEVAYTPETALPSATPVDSSPTSLLSTKPTESSGSVRRATSVRIIIVSVVLPTSLLVTILLCFVLIRRYRKKRSQAFSANHPAMTSNVQLYVDQKAELEDEDRRKQVLEAIDIRHEMGGEDMMFEMSSDGNTQIDFSLSNQRQELRGAEHSNELEVPGNI